MDNQRLDNFRLAHHNLTHRVRLGVTTPPEDIGDLQRTKDDCFRLLAAAEAVCTTCFPVIANK
jgi:hypothetical protein